MKHVEYCCVQWVNFGFAFYYLEFSASGDYSHDTVWRQGRSSGQER